MNAVSGARLLAAIAFGLTLVLLVWTLSSCEPCAVVLTGHCEERQHDEEKPSIGAEPLSLPPAPLSLPYTRPRG